MKAAGAPGAVSHHILRRHELDFVDLRPELEELRLNRSRGVNRFAVVALARTLRCKKSEALDEYAHWATCTATGGRHPRECCVCSVRPSPASPAHTHPAARPAPPTSVC